MIFYFAIQAFERVHPVQGRILRRKRRTQRRPGLAREKLLPFVTRRANQMFKRYVPGLMFFWRLQRLRRRIERDPAARNYTDVALMVDTDYSAEIELYHATESARVAAERARSRAHQIHRFSVTDDGVRS